MLHADATQHSGFLITAPSSGAGKTLVCMALLFALGKDKNILPLQPFKIGPDYIDTKFHSWVAKEESINLDIFLSQPTGVKKLFSRYAEAKTAIVEGVMGFYDTCSQGLSTYNMAKLLQLPTLMLMPAAAQSETLLAMLKGLLEFGKNNFIKGIIFNHVTSAAHYQLLKNLVEKEFKNITVYGYIPKLADVMSSRQLGLDIDVMQNAKQQKKILFLLEQVSAQLDIVQLKKDFCLSKTLSEKNSHLVRKNISHSSKKTKEKHLCIVKDSAFSFTYADDINFFKETFKEVSFCSPLKNQTIPLAADILWIPSGYIPTNDVYKKLAQAKRFRKSLQDFCAQKKNIYAEDMGMVFLSRGIWVEGRFKKMSDLIPMSFSVEKKRMRLGYYVAHEKNSNRIIRGHAFHYSRPLEKNLTHERWQLRKPQGEEPEAGAWRFENIFVTYLHVHFRTQFNAVQKYFL